MTEDEIRELCRRAFEAGFRADLRHWDQSLTSLFEAWWETKQPKPIERRVLENGSW